MEILTIALGATETKQFRKAGSYIEVLSSAGAVTFNLWGQNAGIVNSIQQALSGTFLRADFAAFDIANTSGSAQTIIVLVCDPGEDGGSRRQPGTVDVQNRIASSLVNVSVGLSTTAGFNVGSTALAPASNTKGVRVRNASCNATGGTGNAETTVIAAPATPVSNAPANSMWLAHAFTPNATPAQDGHFEMNITLPAGWGIYLCTNHGGASGAVAGGQVAYELLT